MKRSIAHIQGFMDSLPEQIGKHKADALASMQRGDLESLMKTAEQLMQFDHTSQDDDKVEAASALDDIASFLMQKKQFALARSVIISSLRLKGTLERESGMTTLSYQQLQDCDQQAEKSDRNAQPPGKIPGTSISAVAVMVVAVIITSLAWLYFMFR